MLSFPLCCLTLSMSSGSPWDVTLRMSCTRLYGSVFLFTSLLHRAGGQGSQEHRKMGGSGSWCPQALGRLTDATPFLHPVRTAGGTT